MIDASSLEVVSRSLGLPDASDQELFLAAAKRLGVPRNAVPAELESFVLHAPLELLARAVLLPAVNPNARHQARHRVAALVAGYEDAAPALPVGSQLREPGSLAELAVRFDAAIAARDSAAVDAAAGRLDFDAAPTQIAKRLAPTVVPSLAAAGHANIYVSLLTRPTFVGAGTTMLRPLARSLVTDRARPIRVPPTRVVPDPDRTVGTELLHDLTRVVPVGPASSPFIAPLLYHAEDQHALDMLSGDDGVFTAPVRPPFEILQFGAHAMLQGDPGSAPYGWTHCLTLAQGALGAGPITGDFGPAVYVASAYLAAHWAAYGSGALDLDYVPEPSGLPLSRALFDSPVAAAGAAWHSENLAGTASILATAASVNHDAHRVKYTLACLDAATSDPHARRLYLAAAAYLNAYWYAHPDPQDVSP